MRRTFIAVAFLMASASTVVSAQQGKPPAGVGDPLGRYFFAPDLVMQNAAAIGLTDAQKTTVTTAMQQVQAKMMDAQSRMSAEGDKLTKLVQGPTVDETKMLEEVDRLLAIEKDVRRAQVIMMVRLKNSLNPTQQAKLSQLRGDKP